MTLEQLINDRKIKAKRHDDLPTLLRLKDMKLRVAYYDFPFKSPHFQPALLFAGAKLSA